MREPYTIRSMQAADIPKLIDIRPGFVTPVVLKVERNGEGLHTGWQLVEVAVDPPFDKGRGYDFDRTERENIRQRLGMNNTMLAVVVASEDDRIVGVVDVEERAWNNTAWIWNLMLDKDVRGQGLGRKLIDYTVKWARQRKLRAIMLETQTNNVPACRFYARMGFKLVGINEVFYTNEDVDNNEVAIFWSLPLTQ